MMCGSDWIDFANNYIFIEVECEPDDKAEAYLSDYLEFSCEALFILLEYLYIIVEKSDQTEPYGGYYQKHDVHVLQLGEQQCRNQDRSYNNESAHGRGALLLHLPLQAEVADFLSHLPAAKKPDELLAKEYGDEQRKERCHPCTERDVLKYPRAYQVEFPVQIIKEIVQHSPIQFENNFCIRATTSRSSKGCFTPFISWYVSCPFPATSIMSLSAAIMQAIFIASSRSGMTTTFFASVGVTPSCISRIISIGSSSRGLSDVSTSRSLNLQAIEAMTGRLALSRLPPQPTTVITCPASPRNCSIVSSTFFSASGVWA